MRWRAPCRLGGIRVMLNMRRALPVQPGKQTSSPLGTSQSADNALRAWLGMKEAAN
jgi:hypothetical protein